MNESTIHRSEIEPDSVIVERAVPEDAEAIASLHRETWLATYPNEEAGITEEDIRLRLDGLNGERAAGKVERWRKTLEHKDDTSAVFVARLHGKVVGMTAPRIYPGRRRIGALYVLPEAQGRGVGRALMEKNLEWHGDTEDIYLLAASYNHRAIKFYEHFGFEQTEAVVEDTGPIYGNTKIPEIEMVRRAKV